MIDAEKFISGKLVLNQIVHHVSQNGAAFHIHYWGMMKKHYNNTLHKHAFFEICYVVDGTGYYIDNGLTYRLEKNTMFLSKPDVLHQIRSEEGLFLLYVAFELIESESDELWIRRMADARNCPKVLINIAEPDTEVTLLWKSLLFHASKYKQGIFESMLANLSHSLLLSLLQTFVNYSNWEREDRYDEASSPLLNEVKLYIQDNVSSPLKLTEVAGHFHISGRHLSRLFVSELGITYSEFVQNVRIQRAALLLKTTHLSIKDIARQTGFGTVHYFTRVFAAMLGNSPGRFRMLYMDKNTTAFTKMIKDGRTIVSKGK